MAEPKDAGLRRAPQEVPSGLVEDPRPGFMENLAPATPWPSSARPELSVGLVLVPNFTLLALANFVEALRLAADVGDRSRPRRCQLT